MWDGWGVCTCGEVVEERSVSAPSTHLEQAEEEQLHFVHVPIVALEVGQVVAQIDAAHFFCNRLLLFLRVECDY